MGEATPSSFCGSRIDFNDLNVNPNIYNLKFEPFFLTSRPTLLVMVDINFSLFSSCT